MFMKAFYRLVFNSFSESLRLQIDVNYGLQRERKLIRRFLGPQRLLTRAACLGWWNLSLFLHHKVISGEFREPFYLRGSLWIDKKAVRDGKVQSFVWDEKDEKTYQVLPYLKFQTTTGEVFGCVM